MSLVARHLEANGLPTVIIGSALDIVEHCGVPRFVFTDLPLCNPVGHPWDRAMQRDVVRLALDTLAAADSDLDTPKDGKLTVTELEFHLDRKVRKLTAEQQQPKPYKPGNLHDFPLFEYAK